MIRPQTLDCQACGTTVRTLDAPEAARVADRPYDFIVYCPACRLDNRPDPTVPPISYCRVFQVGPACGRLCEECQAGINALTPEQRRALVAGTLF